MSKKICYIFLDIDGVLNNIHRWEKIYIKKGISAGTYSFDEKNLKNLDLLDYFMSRKYELHYVLSSTWRLSKSGYEIAESRFREHGIKIEGHTSKSWDHRGKQILQYMEGKSYDLLVALDDDDFDINPYLSDNFLLLQTDVRKGLTKKDIFDFLIKL